MGFFDDIVDYWKQTTGVGGATEAEKAKKRREKAEQAIMLKSGPAALEVDLDRARRMEEEKRLRRRRTVATQLFEEEPLTKSMKLGA